MINTGKKPHENNIDCTTANIPITPPDQFFCGSFCELPQNPNARFAGLIIEYRCFDEPETDVQVQICRHCEVQLSICHISCRYVVCPSCICFYLCFENYNLLVLADHLKQDLANMLRNCPVNIYYSEEVNSLEEAERQLNYLRQQLRYSRVYGYDRLFSYQHIYHAETSIDYPLSEEIQIIEEHLFREKYNELTPYLKQLCDQILNPCPPQEENIYSYHSLYHFMETILYLFKFHFRKNVWDSPLNSMILPELLDKHPGIIEFFRFLSACLTEYQTDREMNSVEQRRQFMSKLQRYIEKNLATVTLNSLAEHFHITPAYLSRTFKRDMGQNFSEYLSDCKLQKAAHLLEQGFQINDITKQLGYASPAYFLSKFKGKYGMTPSVYRKRILSYKTGIYGN